MSPETTTPNTTKICPTCGTRLGINATRCSVCGSNLAPSVSVAANKAVSAPRLPAVTLSLPVLFGLVVLLLAAPFLLLRLFSLRRGQPNVQIDQLYRQIRRALGWAGVRAEASVTPEEFLRHSWAQVAPFAALEQALRQVTALYQQAVFSDHPPEAGRVQRASGLWRRSARDWLKLWLQARLKR